VTFEEMEQALRRLEALPPAARAELVHVLRLPDLERVERIGEFWRQLETRTVGELLIDLEADKAARIGLGLARPPAPNTTIVRPSPTPNVGRRPEVAQGPPIDRLGKVWSAARLANPLVAHAENSGDVGLAVELSARHRLRVCFPAGRVYAQDRVFRRSRRVGTGCGGSNSTNAERSPTRTHQASTASVCPTPGPDPIVGEWLRANTCKDLAQALAQEGLQDFVAQAVGGAVLLTTPENVPAKDPKHPDRALAQVLGRWHVQFVQPVRGAG
jgi:hypothetical protein